MSQLLNLIFFFNIVIYHIFFLKQNNYYFATICNEHVHSPSCLTQVTILNFEKTMDSIFKRFRSFNNIKIINLFFLNNIVKVHINVFEYCVVF